MWYRVKRSYQKLQGGFLAVGPRYRGEPVEGDPTRVLFRHHGDPRWIEVVTLEHPEEAPEEPKRRNRWK